MSEICPLIRNLLKDQMSFTSLLPIAKWGIDIISHFLTGKEGVKYAIVAMDYFTK